MVRGELAYAGFPCCGDFGFRLVDDDRYYYVNDDHVPEMDVDGFLAEVPVGAEVELTVIRRGWSPLDWRHRVNPVPSSICIAPTREAKFRPNRHIG